MEHEGEELLPAEDEDVLFNICLALGRIPEFRDKIAGSQDLRRLMVADRIMSQLKLAGIRLFRTVPLRGH